MSEYFFRRYRNGQRMAENVRITQAATLEEACLSASRIAAQYNDGTVLVSECGVDLRAELATERDRVKAAYEELGATRNIRDKYERERLTLRAVLREARLRVFPSDYLRSRIDAALNKGGTDE